MRSTEAVFLMSEALLPFTSFRVADTKKNYFQWLNKSNTKIRHHLFYAPIPIGIAVKNSYLAVMKAIRLNIHPENPQQRFIDQAVEVLKDGGLVIYPTDTVYGIGCDIFNTRAVDRLCRVKGVKPEKSNFSFVCTDLSMVSEYSRGITTPVFKLMKRTLPGPYTYILNASSQVPKILQKKKRTVGVRIPDQKILQQMLVTLGTPIITTSLKIADDILEYPTDPEEIYELFSHKVDVIIDGGPGGVIPSTVVDCTNDEPVLIREGEGPWPA